jgi:peptidoglycan/xylan/chitin deacetylase (PgdA/CDA1 family)
MSTTRRGFVVTGAAAVAPATALAQAPAARPAGRFWPDGARLPIVFSLVWESGSEPPATLPVPAGTSAPPGTRYPDFAGDSDVSYGYREGLPRLLELLGRARVPATAFICAKSTEASPALAREIAERGHECAAHGYTHDAQYQLPRDDERAVIANATETIRRATGQRPVGYNCRGQQRSVNTTSLLQELGYVYHIDDYSRDQPFIVDANGKPFVIVPYTTNTDVHHFRAVGGSISAFAEALKEEFDQLYAEAGQRPRVMSVTAHDEVAGRAARVGLYERFIAYAKQHPGVWFARTGEVARWALQSPQTLRESG